MPPSLSLFFWMGKTAVALVNVSFYGNRHRNEPGFSYSEGFWSAVVSVIMAGVISIALTLHYLFAFGRLQADDSEDLRLTGRKFMFSVTFFMFLLGIQALAFNRIEHWSYLDSIYFSLQCALTVGYGDLVATTAAGKVLVFVFSVLTISQLANEVSIIIEFVRNRSEERRDQWRKKYSVAMHTQAIKRHPYATLIDEMSLIHQINLHQET
jgi:potassium channel subfamily K